MQISIEKTITELERMSGVLGDAGEVTEETFSALLGLLTQDG